MVSNLQNLLILFSILLGIFGICFNIKNYKNSIFDKKQLLSIMEDYNKSFQAQNTINTLVSNDYIQKRIEERKKSRHFELTSKWRRRNSREIKTGKPTIYLVEKSKKMWACGFRTSSLGYGKTPKIAFEQWKAIVHFENKLRSNKNGY